MLGVGHVNDLLNGCLLQAVRIGQGAGDEEVEKPMHRRVGGLVVSPHRMMQAGGELERDSVIARLCNGMRQLGASRQCPGLAAAAELPPRGPPTVTPRRPRRGSVPAEL